MVKVREDMTGWKMWEHGIPDSKIIVIKQVDDYIKPDGRHEARWLCECSCENHNKFTAIATSIKSGKTKSCGCLQKDELMTISLNNCKTNKYDLSGEYGIGWTTNTNKEFYFDLEDYDIIKNYCWSEAIRKRSYHEIATNIKGTHKTKTMAQIIMGENNIDHIDRNPFNNRRKNFRMATKSQNSQNAKKYKNNSSGFTGVQWNKSNNKWTAHININKKRTYLCSFKNKEDAIKSRLQAELKYYGEFAPQRHLFEEYGIACVINQNVNITSIDTLLTIQNYSKGTSK